MLAALASPPNTTVLARSYEITSSTVNCEKCDFCIKAIMGYKMIYNPKKAIVYVKRIKIKFVDKITRLFLVAFL